MNEFEKSVLSEKVFRNISKSAQIFITYLQCAHSHKVPWKLRHGHIYLAAEKACLESLEVNTFSLTIFLAVTTEKC